MGLQMTSSFLIVSVLVVVSFVFALQGCGGRNHSDSPRFRGSNPQPPKSTCDRLQHEECDAKVGTCQWKWIGNWESSCVPFGCAGWNSSNCSRFADVGLCQWNYTGDWKTSCV